MKIDDMRPKPRRYKPDPDKAKEFWVVPIYSEGTYLASTNRAKLKQFGGGKKIKLIPLKAIY